MNDYDEFDLAGLGDITPEDRNKIRQVCAQSGVDTRRVILEIIRSRTVESVQELRKILNKPVFYCDSARHLVCKPYSIENLHAMAKELGIHKCWFHGGTNPHYDIPKRRIYEIQAKCKLVSSREILSIIKGDT